MSQSCTPNRPCAFHGDVSPSKDKDTKGATRINDCNEWSKVMWLPLILGIIAGIFLGIMITSMCAAGAIADKDREIARLKELRK